MKVHERVAALVDRIDASGEQGIRDAVPKLCAYLGLLQEANREVNLVSRRTTPEELIERHLADSLVGLACLPRGDARERRMLDIGSGGGFPAIPILIARADMRGTLLESVGKKSRFLNRVVAELQLTAEVVNARFPDSFPMRAVKFDVLTSRAVAEAGLLARQAAPFLAAKGRVLLWTTEPLLPLIEKDSGMHRIAFEPAPGSERRGVVWLERST